MTKREIYEKKTEELLEPIMEREGFELVDVEYLKEGGSWYLRAYIDKPGGIFINDCEQVSRQLSEYLDEADFIQEPYILEVSSPGLLRPLKKEKDYRRNLGKEVEVKTYLGIQGRKEFRGVLKRFSEEEVQIMEAEEEIVLKKKDISLIRLAFDF